MICCKEIDAYIEKYETCPNVFNNERKLLMENIVKPLLKRDDITFDEETYYNCIKFCERWFYKLVDYQKFIYAFVFMYDKNDIPVFRTFIILMGRGNGKDGMIVPLITFLSSEYYGVKGYNIDIVATAEEQAEDTYKVLYNVLEDNKVKFRKHFYWNKEECINRKTKSTIKFNTSNAKTKDGKKDGAVVFNEYHGYQTDKQIKVFQSGLGKVKHPRIFIITTQGDIREGPLDELLSVCNGVLNGESNDLRYFPFLCKLDNEKEVDDPEMWKKANPSLEFFPNLADNMMIDYLEMQKFPSKKPEFMTKRMNLPMQRQDEIVTSWDNLLKASYKDIKNKIERDTPDLNRKKAVVGLDMANLNDFASAGFLFKVGDEYIWRHKTWICANGKFFNDIKFPFYLAGEEGYKDFEVVHKNSIPEEEIISWVMNEICKYCLKRIKMDTYQFKLYKKTFEKYGITVYNPKTNPDGQLEMIKYPASIAAIYAPKIEVEFEEGRINIGNSAMMRWAVNNTKTVIQKDGNRKYEKIEPKLRKNDTFMAFVAAFSGYELLDEEVIYV
ncbi:MAG: terminase large subunit [Clostridia bacterium]|nr:terminase large subunit [Clostridia bacterium]